MHLFSGALSKQLPFYLILKALQYSCMKLGDCHKEDALVTF